MPIGPCDKFSILCRVSCRSLRLQNKVRKNISSSPTCAKEYLTFRKPSYLSNPDARRYLPSHTQRTRAPRAPSGPGPSCGKKQSSINKAPLHYITQWGSFIWTGNNYVDYSLKFQMSLCWCRQENVLISNSSHIYLRWTVGSPGFVYTNTLIFATGS